MRYSILTGWLLLLIIPFLPLQQGRAAISPSEAIEFPIRYLRIFRSTYEPYLHIRPAIKAPDIKRPGQPATVKTWRDENGVVHFSDHDNAPEHASDKTLDIAPNSDLIASANETRQWHGNTTNNSIFAALLLAGSALLIAIIHQLLVFGFRAITMLKALRLARTSDDEEPKPRQPASIEYNTHSSSDPYAVLGISAKASNHNVRSAYEKARSRYDTSQLLGMTPAQQEAARMKAQEIEHAWQRIRTERSMG